VSLRRAPFHRVLYRPALWLGGERELTGSTAVIAIGLAVLGQNLIALTVAALLWFMAIYLLRQMAKSDAQMSRVYLRQIRYRGYYPPRSRPYAGGSSLGAAAQWSILIVGVLAALALVYWKA
jgi:type IV secretory pathway TrbD component